MSLYSLDSLEAEVCLSENEAAGAMWIEREIPGSGAAEAVETRQVVVKSGADDKPMKAEKRNALIARAEPLPQAQPSPEVIPCRISPDESRRSSSTLELSESSKITSNISKLKNDKKLKNVLPQKIIEAKTKPKTYLEQYHQRVGRSRSLNNAKDVVSRSTFSGLPPRVGIYSPEGSALSIFGDSSYGQISDVESHPTASTSRDDQSELSFYRRLINQPRTTRSWDVNDRFIAGGNLRSISDYGLTMNREKHRVSYRPYSIRDYECLTVPRADRSLGPDPVEIREKWEKLMRRTQYGELASSRNRQNLVRRFELRKCKRTNVQKPSGEFPLTEDVGAGLVPESKNLTVELQPDVKSPEINSAGLKKAPRTLRPRRILKTEIERRTKSSAKFKTLEPSSRKTLIRSLEQGPGVSSLEDLQRRHQNEKRVMEILINRTLLR